MKATLERPPVDPSLSAFGPARATVEGTPLKGDELHALHTFWRACNYLAVGMIYLQDNALLKEPLKPEQVKHRLLGHWGSSPGISFLYTHLNRVIKKLDQDMLFMVGAGHGAPGFLGPCYLEGTYSEFFTDKTMGRGTAKVLQVVFLPRWRRQPLHP